MEFPYRIDGDGTEFYKTKDGYRVEWPDGDKRWYVNGLYHRLDGPAIEYADGGKEWYVEGKLHRLDGPAIEWAGGTKEWYIKGKQMTKQQFNKWRLKHNPIKESRAENLKQLASMEVPIESGVGYDVYKIKDGYRYEYAAGDIYYLNNNKAIHRIGGPAVIHRNGDYSWQINEKFHRVDGPAVRFTDENGNVKFLWYVNDMLHRVDGPAIEWSDGHKEWYVNGKEMTEEQFNQWRAENNPIKESRSDIIKQLASMEVPFKIDGSGNEHYKTKDGYKVVWPDDSEIWIANGNYHRLDGPAIISPSGNKGWYVKGKLHRVDGPAIERADGSKLWYINGKQITEKQFNKWRAKHNPVTENRKTNIMQLVMYQKEMQDILNTNPILQAVVDHYWSYMGSLVFGPKEGDDKNDFVEAILKYAEDFGYTDKKNPDLFLEKDFDMYVETRDKGLGEKDEAGLFDEYVSWLVDMLEDNYLLQ